jgi:hypothetical protein
MPEAEYFNIVIEQGSSWSMIVLWTKPDGVTPEPLGGYSAKMQIRHLADDSTVLMELTDVNNRIVLGGTAGTIQLKLTPSETLSFTHSTPSRPHVYDLVVTSGAGLSTKVMKGNFVSLRAVTRA